MSPDVSRVRATRSACVATLIAALVLIPPMASAFDGSRGLACSSPRTNRASAASVAKAKAKPLSDTTGWAFGAAQDQRFWRGTATALVFDEPNQDSPGPVSPETRRGPPPVRFA